MQRLHHEHIVYYFIYIFSISNLLLKALVNYRFNDFDLKYLALVYKRHQILDISIHIKGLKKAKSLEKTFSTRLSFLLWDFWSRVSRNDVSHYLIASTIIHVLRHDFGLKFENVFIFFFFVFVLTTNENRMHAQRFAEERTLLSYKRTQYLCIFQLF